MYNSTFPVALRTRAAECSDEAESAKIPCGGSLDAFKELRVAADPSSCDAAFSGQTVSARPHDEAKERLPSRPGGNPRCCRGPSG